MSTYLIDFENVKSGGLTGIEYIRKEDSVHLFWSKRENKISIEMMELIRSSESEIVMHQAVTGERDALDHQLCSYLGFLAGSKGENDFVIISNDKAYDHLIEFWRKLDDGIRIRRVPEISKISEQLRVQETAVITEKALTEKNMDRAEQTAAELESIYSEGRGGRNSRRRDRGGKYLRGGRNGRNNWRSAYQEEEQEETAAMNPVITVQVERAEVPAEGNAAEDQNAAVEEAIVKETVVKEAAVKETVAKESAMKETVAEEIAAEETVIKETSDKEETKKSEKDSIKETMEQTETVVKKELDKPVKEVGKPAVENKVSTALVVTGIRTGILVESGFTADGILEHRKPTEEPKTEKAEKDLKPAEKAKAEAAEKDLKPAEEAKTEAAEKELKPAEEAKEEKTVQAVSVENTEGEEEIISEVQTKDEMEAEAVKPASEKRSDRRKNNRKAENSEEEKTEKSEKPVRKRTPRKKPEKNSKGKTAVVSEVDKTAEKVIEKATEKAVEKELETVAENTQEKPENKNRARRGRPPKKNHMEVSQTVKAPATVSDVIAKCESAANEKWAGEVAELINQSRDKKELYAAIVKLLGQEKGRTVYHAIKVLK